MADRTCIDQHALYQPAKDSHLCQPAPLISVIVPVRNEGPFIASTLEQILRQDYPADGYEIIVADGRSTDSTRQIVSAMARRHPNVRLVDNPKCWSSAGRNAAIRVARGQIIVVIDGHCQLLDEHYLANVAETFATSGADCLGRPQPQDVPDTDDVGRAIAAARASWLGHHFSSYIYSTKERFVPAHSVAVAYRRSVFDRVGMFDESFDACEDVELNHRVDRAGMKCFFTPKIQVRYYPRTSLGQLFRQLVRYGRGRARLLCKHPDTFSVATLIPAGLVAALALSPLLVWAWPALSTAYATVLALYFLPLLFVSVTIVLRTGSLRMLFWLPPIFVAIHAGAGVGVLAELGLTAWSCVQFGESPVLGEERQ